MLGRLNSWVTWSWTYLLAIWFLLVIALVYILRGPLKITESIESASLYLNNLTPKFYVALTGTSSLVSGIILIFKYFKNNNNENLNGTGSEDGSDVEDAIENGSTSSRFFPDFTKEGKRSKFRMVVEGKPIYFLPPLMAELSPYFEKICYDENFVEKGAGEVEIAGEKYDEVKEMFEVIGPLPSRSIDANNCAALLHLADRFDIPCLTKRVLDFISGCVCSLRFFADKMEAIRLLKVADEIQLEDKQIMTRIVRMVAQIEMAKLKASGVFAELSQNLAVALMECAATNVCVDQFDHVFSSRVDGPRTVFSTHQLKRLNEEFEVNKYPLKERRQQLADELGLTVSTIYDWFKNRRLRKKEEEERKSGQNHR